MLLYLARSQSEVFLNGKKAQVLTARGITDSSKYGFCATNKTEPIVSPIMKLA